jgi:solute carrier family 25 (mitochondrial folate transporter), member 32
MSREDPSRNQSDYQNASPSSREGVSGPSRGPNGFQVPLSGLAVLTANLSDGAVNGLCGAMAGMASGMVTCPLDVIKTRLQAQGSFRRSTNARVPTNHLYNGLIGTARTIWLQDGIRGMYRGLGPMLLGYLPTWAVYMSVYDSSKNYYGTHVGTLHQI